MKALTGLEKQILALSPAERERLATLAWESLVGDPPAAANSDIDPAATELAAQRDSEIESDKVQTIGDLEFRRRTDGAPE